MPQNRSRTSCFPRLPLSRRLLSWLLFRHSLNSPDWQVQLREQFGDNKPALSRAMQQWLQQQPGYGLVHSSSWPLLLLAAVVGALTLTGICSYSGNAPINLWLLLGLFALLPLLMAVLGLWSWRSVRTPAAALPVSAQLLFRPLLSKVGEWQLDSHLLKPWLLWRLQGLALAFQLGAIAGFLMLALFQDLAFGWSSTLVERGTWMDDFLLLMSAPWSWLLAAPSEELLTASHFYRGSEGFNAELLRQWWSYLVMVMITYGALPRLLLALWMGSRVSKYLRSEMANSGDLERFKRALFGITNGTDAAHELEKQPLAAASDWNNQQIRLAWQWQPQQITTEAVLGLQSWEQESHWLAQQAIDWKHPVAILITGQQVPTAELADVVAVIRKANSKLPVELWLLSSQQQITEGARKSWQLFARKYALSFSERAGQPL